MKFINLLKKELAELINAQMILGLVITMMIFAILGGVLNKTVASVVDEVSDVKINICDRDKTEFTDELIKGMDAKVTMLESSGDDYAAILKELDVNSLVIIPEGFTEAVEKGEPPELITASRMKSTSATANLNIGSSNAVSAISAALESSIAARAGISEEQLELMASPLTVLENTVVDDKSASVSPDSVVGSVMMQNMIMPIIVFILILLTSQTLMTSISNEKIDKTLETLLSAPISRGSVIGAKMLAAAIVALLNAAAYMVGFSVFMSGMSDSVTNTMGGEISAAASSFSADDALTQLGLTLSASDYFFIGIQLFLTILICLSVSIVLGALANDTKSSQTLIMPIMLLAMIPYIISMAADVNTLPTVLRYIVYAIPFTHTFSAISNLMFGNTLLFFGGLIYQVLFFALCMFFALKLFKSDKIFTISLNLGQKSKYKKSKKNS